MNYDPQPQDTPTAVEHTSPDTPQPQPPQQEQPKKKGKGFFIACLIPALLMATWDTIVENAFDHFHQRAQTQQIEEVIDAYAKSENYTPGICTEDSYVSEYLDLEFHSNDHWVMYTQETIDEATTSVGGSLTAALPALLEGANAPQSIIDLCLEKTFSSCEMGAEYYDADGYYTGIGIMLAMNLPLDPDDLSDTGNQLSSGLAKGIVKNEGIVVTQDTAVSEHQFINTTVDVVTIPIKYTESGINAEVSCWVYYKNGIICYFMCIDIGPSNEVLPSFLEQFTELDTAAAQPATEATAATEVTKETEATAATEVTKETEAANEETQAYDLDEIKDRFAQAKPYTPGILTEDSYTSEYLNLEFQTGGQWTLMDAETIADFTDATGDGLVDSLLLSTLREENAPQELIDLMAENTFCMGEMVAVTNDQSSFTLMLTTNIPLALGISPKTVSTLLLDSLQEDDGENSTASQISFAGTEQQIVTTQEKDSETGEVYNTSYWTYTKDDVLCFFVCYYPEESEDVFTSFTEQFNTLKN